MNCYDAIDLMDVALEGRVPEASRPGFDQHMLDCSPCRNYFDQLASTVRALHRLPRELAPPDPGLRASLLRAFRERTRREDG